ncbi:ribonuclease BN [Streptomyces sp. NPDC008313]|uniref:ribonuclease BN n=1 Tax=Streptomyces sp. NPDC008313 TaxID=3364826 RepID=UPI0036E5F003
MNRYWHTLLHAGRRLGAHPLIRQGREFELMHRAMGFATLSLVTLAPLLIVVAAADPLKRTGFASWLVDGMGLSGRSAREVTRIISPPRSVIGATSVLGGVTLAVFGVAFGGSVQNGYERIWRLPPGPWHRIWRQAMWLAALTAYLYQEVLTRIALYGWLRTAVSALTGVAFFWWGQHFLLGGQIHRRDLLPGAVFTMIGLGGLRAFSQIVLTPLLVSNAISYGGVGVVLIVESWLIGVGFVIYGGALFGRWFTSHHWWERTIDHGDRSPPR